MKRSVQPSSSSAEPSNPPHLYPHITGCILARNEEARIEDALRSLDGWTQQIIVLDNESKDRTADIARAFGALVIAAPTPDDSTNFDALRELATPYATGDWIFYLDADERVPEPLGNILLQVIREHDNEFDALAIPFKSYFCGKWMEHSGWWPGYTRPQLLRKGRFRYKNRLHSGIDVAGKSVFFSAENPALAIQHYSYDDLTHYLTKLNRYTDGEAENLREEGHSHTWKAQIAHFVHDWQTY